MLWRNQLILFHFILGFHSIPQSLNILMLELSKKKAISVGESLDAHVNTEEDLLDDVGYVHNCSKKNYAFKGIEIVVITVGGVGCYLWKEVVDQVIGLPEAHALKQDDLSHPR